MNERLGASFRDPAGFVFRRDGELFRQVNEVGLSDYRLLHSSGLYDALAGRLLVPHDEVGDAPAELERAALVIRPEPIPFVSYPYEWCPGQLRAAALATLEIQRTAIAHGMSLRDASAYNIQFRGGSPVLIDTLSFEAADESRPWVAYGQFCRHFLAPLALMVHLDARLGALMRSEIDGIPLDLAARLLPRRSRLNVGIGLHVHAHASSQARHSADGRGAAGAPSTRAFSHRAMLGLIDSLESAVRKLTWRPPKSAWRDYYSDRESYTEDSLSAKASLVADAVRAHAPGLVLDLGANTGRFSRLAAELTGADVVSAEMDPAAVELNYQSIREDGVEHVLPLLVDLTNPSPAQGWAHRERASLEDRGPADLVLALALVHHLAIGNNVPLPSIFEWFARLGRRAVVEWIPKTDPMVQRLLATREDVFPDYAAGPFELALARWFEIESVADVAGSERRIYVLKARTSR